jgi:TolB protein
VRDDGSDLRVVVKAPVGDVEGFGSPVWSPDGKRVYFVGGLGLRAGDRFHYVESDAFVVDARGGEPRRITTSRDVDSAVPSPDGRTLLVTRDEHPGKRPFTTGLWLLDADGGNERRLLPAEDGQLDFAGSWSPDGRTIAFTRCSQLLPDASGLIENTCAIYTVSADGFGLRELAERSSGPAYSPDGRLIAFASDRDEHGRHATGNDEEMFSSELYVMEADGDDQRRLTETESLDENGPVWSPDGSRIAYTRTGPARFKDQVMVLHADGTCPTVLVGDASDAGIETPSFYASGWRPGRVTGRLAPLACG